MGNTSVTSGMQPAWRVSLVFINMSGHFPRTGTGATVLQPAISPVLSPPRPPRQGPVHVQVGEPVRVQVGEQAPPRSALRSESRLASRRAGGLVLRLARRSDERSAAPRSTSRRVGPRAGGEPTSQYDRQAPDRPGLGSL